MYDTRAYGCSSVQGFAPALYNDLISYLVLVFYFFIPGLCKHLLMHLIDVLFEVLEPATASSISQNAIEAEAVTPRG